MNPSPDARRLRGAALDEAFVAARDATWRATLDLTDEQWRVPYHRGIQPTAWDLAHIAWFAEFWLLRGPHRLGIDGLLRAERNAPVIGRDHHHDSAAITHEERWRIPAWSRAELQDKLGEQLALCRAAAHRGDDDPDTLYHARFAVFHELMHVEALWWTRGILGYAAPTHLRLPRLRPRPEVKCDGGEFGLGQRRDEDRFAFDNELPGHTVRLAPFRIDAQPVSNAQFLAFVQGDGYADESAWTAAGWRWLQRERRQHPERWRCDRDGAWQQRWFERWVELPLDEPVIHVNAHEAEAYCAFVGRRLPRAAEWEAAADRITWGRSVWEWTADAFAPYPSFRPAPYTTYSAPWFHKQREMRGGAFTTHELMHDRRYRNFFLPQRTDVFAGFRTAADG
ncbi:MAG: SUMF1/EgtB/PvdO family nonheme iron enzyme [Planctomycetes bacterium]|nr:SUMF1/EgtB/PvdO family nonheme iron enzyme [Planctomycetota bacterium]